MKGHESRLQETEMAQLRRMEGVTRLDKEYGCKGGTEARG